MKKINLLILSILSIYTYGQKVSVEFANDMYFDSCNAPAELPVVICEDGDSQVVLQRNQKGHLFGIYRNGSIKETEIFPVRTISDGKNVIFHNANSEQFVSQRAVEEFDTPAGRLKDMDDAQKSIFSLIRNIHPSHKEIRDSLQNFLEGVENDIERQNEKVTQAYTKMWVQDNSNKNHQCEMATKCTIKKCGDNHYIIFDPSRNVYMPINYSRDNRGNAQFTKNDSYIKYARTLGGAIIERNAEYEKSRLTAQRKAPEVMGNNSSAFFSMQDAGFSDYLKTVLPHCTKEVQGDIIALGRQSVRERDNLDFVHLVDVVNGNINSQYINRQFLPKNSCRDGDSYYASDSYEKVKEYRPRASGVISLQKANELFKKARAMKGMAWKYVQDGCYARSELMVNMFEEEGVVADKAWASGKLKIPNQQYPFWSYHTAPVVYVDNGRGGVSKMIIDPSIASKPIEVNEWLKTMGADASKVDHVGFPPSLDAISVGRTAFGIASRDSYHPQTASNMMSREARAIAAKTLLATYEKRTL
ncbi:protein-glutamine glutaminase family protein [Halobacteriovorax sp. DA5]|uniref:protein-glutamine glutaminase family protein n=1 Tax=Halobacteriovorax sp. DA5 TaxID=2067553 RepID=UPI000CCFF164|nr:protein-glutamine glutaminase family protein [Halobacteriovorax sp. DA5]POB13981.1 hypothetical protein C0Z22_07945 [Halobacteriovorax sp. DA5]